MRWIFAVLLLAPVSAAIAAPCGGPTGRYDGTAQTPGGVSTEFTLNLYCDKGRYAAQLFTAMGDFAVKSASGAQGHARIAFDSGASLGSMNLDAKGDTLSGPLDFGGDKGSVSLVRRGDAMAADAFTPRLDLTPAQWREDIRALAEQLPKHHANAFFSLPRAEFDAEIAALDKRADAADGDAIFVGLQQITKSIGDGHTGMVAPADRRVMPIQVARFGDDFRITAAGRGLERALGMRIEKIAGVPIAQVWTQVLTLTARGELMALRESDGLVYLARGYALHGLGITPDRAHAVYTLADDGGRAVDLDIEGLKPGEKADLKSGFSGAALRDQQKDEAFWCKPFAERQAVFCEWRAYENLHGNAQAMFALVDKVKPGKLIIDMRDNGGGDNTVGYAELVKPLEAHADLNQRGHLYVLIGPQTFSAAMNNAAQFQDETKAILVGQTIGEKPNSYQEPRQFRLPNSHLIVRASTLWYAFRKKGPNEVAPDKAITPSWDDVKNGRDPVLDWALNAPVK